MCVNVLFHANHAIPLNEICCPLNFEAKQKGLVL